MRALGAERGSRESPEGSVREVAAQMPTVSIKVQNGSAIDDIALNATTPNPAQTTSAVTAAATQAAPSVRSASDR